MLQESKLVANAKVRDAAYEAKMEKAMTKQRYEAQRRQEEHKAHQMKLMISQQKADARTKKEFEQIDKSNRTRGQIEEKLQREA